MNVRYNKIYIKSSVDSSSVSFQTHFIHFNTCKISEKARTLKSNMATKSELKFDKRFCLLVKLLRNIKTEVQSRSSLVHPHWALSALKTDAYRLARSMLLTPNSSSCNKDKQLYSVITFILSGFGNYKYVPFSGSKGASSDEMTI